MFIGHFALGFAAKRYVPRVSLAVLFVAAQWADLLWPVLVGAGLERVRIEPGNTAMTPLDFISYPYSHSLLMLAVWGAVLGLAYRIGSGHNGRGLTVIAALVVSHWILDVVTHRPDMPLYPEGPRFGLGLWNSVVATVVVEVLMFAVAVWLYARATNARDAIGRWGFLIFVVFLLLAYAANIIGGPPPSTTVLWVSALAGALILLAWSWWFDSHRVTRVGSQSR